MKNTSIITLKDLDRIKNTIVPKQNESEIRKLYDIKLKEINAHKMKEWPNSLENKEKAKLEFKKMKFLKDEEMRRRIDEEEAKFQIKQKEMIVEKAREKYFYQQDPVKAFVSKMRFSDILQERKLQIQQSQFRLFVVPTGKCKREYSDEEIKDCCYGVLKIMKEKLVTSLDFSPKKKNPKDLHCYGEFKYKFIPLEKDISIEKLTEMINCALDAISQSPLKNLTAKAEEEK